MLERIFGSSRLLLLDPSHPPRKLSPKEIRDMTPTAEDLDRVLPTGFDRAGCEASSQEDADLTDNDFNTVITGSHGGILHAAA